MLSSATAQTLPPQISAVQKYILEEDYPETFGGTHYKTKIQNVVVADLDGDGQTEVIVHYMPHYRQSPPIVIYRVAPDLAVKRVSEGLAPGPLQSVTGEFLDSHTLQLGETVDMSIGGQQDDAAIRRKVAESLLKEGANVVEYVNFFHADIHPGIKLGTYTDMTGLAETPETKTCENVQFSTVRQISAGAVSELGSGILLAAWAGTKVYLYQIKSFPNSGFLDKNMWTVDVTTEFNGFAPGAGGPLKYVTASGTERPFVIHCNARQCMQMQ